MTKPPLPSPRRGQQRRREEKGTGLSKAQATREGVNVTVMDGGEFGVLRVEVDRIEVTSALPQPDKEWRYTDREGHEHYWQDGDYPTLRTVVDGTWYVDAWDEIEETHLECAVCGETITPGTVGPSAFREYVPGRRSYFLDDEPISEERAREIAAARGWRL